MFYWRNKANVSDHLPDSLATITELVSNQARFTEMQPLRRSRTMYSWKSSIYTFKLTTVMDIRMARGICGIR